MKLFVSDLDGTLLDTLDGFSKQNEAALFEAKHAGYEIVIASGRMLPAMQQMGLDRFQPYWIAMNGAVVYDPHGHCLFENALSPQEIEAIISYCEERDLIYLVYDGTKIYLKVPDDIEEQIHLMAKKQANNEEDYQERVRFFHEIYTPCPKLDAEIISDICKGKQQIHKVEIVSHDEFALQQVDHMFQDRFSVSCSWVTNREITKSHVNKGTALAALCKHLSLDAKDCVAIGDNRNDLEMLEYAGVAIAMGNASEQVKQICDMQCCSCEEHGVAEAIATLLHS